MVRFTLAAALTIAAFPAQASYPFIGKWDCGVGVFTFTSRTYHNGSSTMRFESILFGGRSDYQLRFPDGYRISLFNVGKKTMTWHSLASGDTFDCKRVTK